MNRFMEKIVFCGLVTACRLATCPTSRSPSFVKATTDGTVRPPSALGMTTGSPPSMTATHEFVVPRSIPIALGMCFAPSDGSHHSMSDCRGQALQQLALPTVLRVFRARPALHHLARFEEERGDVVGRPGANWLGCNLEVQQKLVVRYQVGRVAVAEIGLRL